MGSEAARLVFRFQLFFLSGYGFGLLMMAVLVITAFTGYPATPFLWVWLGIAVIVPSNAYGIWQLVRGLSLIKARYRMEKEKSPSWSIFVNTDDFDRWVFANRRDGRGQN